MSGQGEEKRTCGECSLCCKLMAVPEINKQAGEWCEFVQINGKVRQGCACYEYRPKACRDFECRWLGSAKAGYPMPEEHRPDRIKAVFAGTGDGKTCIVHIDARTPTHYKDHPVVRKVINSLLERWVVVVVCGEERKMLIGGPIDE